MAFKIIDKLAESCKIDDEHFLHLEQFKLDRFLYVGTNSDKKRHCYHFSLAA